MGSTPFARSRSASAVDIARTIAGDEDENRSHSCGAPAARRLRRDGGGLRRTAPGRRRRERLRRHRRAARGAHVAVTSILERPERRPAPLRAGHAQRARRRPRPRRRPERRSATTPSWRSSSPQLRHGTAASSRSRDVLGVSGARESAPLVRRSRTCRPLAAAIDAALDAPTPRTPRPIARRSAASTRASGRCAARSRRSARRLRGSQGRLDGAGARVPARRGRSPRRRPVRVHARDRGRLGAPARRPGGDARPTARRAGRGCSSTTARPCRRSPSGCASRRAAAGIPVVPVTETLPAGSDVPAVAARTGTRARAGARGGET